MTGEKIVEPDGSDRWKAIDTWSIPNTEIVYLPISTI